MDRTRSVRITQVVESRGGAGPFLTKPGDAVLVKREVPRLLVLRCPCGCGDDIVLNLDRRAGAAWRFYGELPNRPSLSPSVWRSAGCESHFVVWRGHVYWFDGDDYWESTRETEERVRRALPESHFVPFHDIAEEVDEDLWAVMAACRALVRAGEAVEGTAASRGAFRRVGKRAKGK